QRSLTVARPVRALRERRRRARRIRGRGARAVRGGGGIARQDAASTKDTAHERRPDARIRANPGAAHDPFTARARPLFPSHLETTMPHSALRPLLLACALALGTATMTASA